MPAVFVVIWSTGFIVAKFGLPYTPPLRFLAIRYFLSLICFLVWIALARVAWPRSRSQWFHLGVTGILIHAGYLGGVWCAIKAGMGSGLSALIVGLQPVLTAVWVSQMGGVRLQGSAVSRRQWLGLLLGLAGLIMVVSRKFGVGMEASPLTLGLAVFALLSITTGTLYQKRFVGSADVRCANAIQLGAALLVTFPLSLFENESTQWTPGYLGALAWSVLGLTLGGSSLLYLLIQRGAATAVTSLLYLVPPTTALMAWLAFDEPITAMTLMGTAFTALGVSMVVRQPVVKKVRSEADNTAI
ncbi:MAG TPA: DMT family transporter [Burkholderiaceae bacterium]|nr:DMT family transporter [Burkholderiaceae bacterium]